MCGIIPNRPRTLTSEQSAVVATALADELIRSCGMAADERDEIIADIVHCAEPHMDGYELAKALDDRCGWICNLAMAEILDAWSMRSALELERLEAEWERFWNVQPQLSRGDRVRLPHGETGTIDGVYTHGAAKYLVRVDNDDRAGRPTNARRIVAFEDAKPIVPSGSEAVGATST